MCKLAKKIDGSSRIGFGRYFGIGKIAKMPPFTVFHYSCSPCSMSSNPNDPFIARCIGLKLPSVVILLGLRGLSKIALSIVESVAILVIYGNHRSPDNEGVQTKVTADTLASIEASGRRGRVGMPKMLFAPLDILPIYEAPKSSGKWEICNRWADWNNRFFRNARGILGRHGYSPVSFVRQAVMSQNATMLIIPCFGGAK